MQKVEELLKIAKALHEPVLLHLITKKGKGYELAEKMPAAYHGVGKFDPALAPAPFTSRAFPMSSGRR